MKTATPVTQKGEVHFCGSILRHLKIALNAIWREQGILSPLARPPQFSFLTGAVPIVTVRFMGRIIQRENSFRDRDKEEGHATDEALFSCWPKLDRLPSSDVFVLGANRCW